MTDELKLWEQQADEPDLHYRVFRRWLLQDEPRDIHEAYRDEIGKQYHRKKRVYAPADILAAVPGWEVRARAWDIEQARRDTYYWQQARREIRMNEYAVSQALMDRAKEMLQWPIYTDEVIESEDEAGSFTTIIRKPAKWAFRDVSGMVKVASEIQRLAAEMESSISKLVIAFSPQAFEAMTELEKHGVDASVAVGQFEQMLISLAAKYKEK